MTTEPRTVPAVLERMARQLPDHEALVSPDRRFTFAQLRDEVRRAAAAMIALGVAVATAWRSGRRTPGTGWWRAWPFTMPAR